MEDHRTPRIPRLYERYPYGPYCPGVLDVLRYPADAPEAATIAARMHLDYCNGCLARSLGYQRSN
jgi:hypothetical protein